MARYFSVFLLFFMGAAFIELPQWKIQQQASRIGFSGTQIGVTFEGEFENYQTEISFDPNSLASARVRVVIDMKSAKTGNKDRDAALAGPEWFAAVTYPDGIFESTGFTLLGENLYQVEAILTLRDISRDVVLPFELKIDDDKAHLTGQLTIDRRDFGIGQGTQWESDKWVAYPVKIMIDVMADHIH